MEKLFFALLTKIIPLYMNIGLGYIAAKALDVHRESIAKIMFFLINPLIILNGVLSVELTPSVLSLPVLTFCLATCIGILFYYWGSHIWEDSTSNLLAFSAGTGNTGYFGIPVAIILFTDLGEGIYILAILGLTLFENSIGYYIMSRGTHQVHDCLIKLIKIPAIYAFFGGIALNFWGVPVPAIFADFMNHIKGTFTVLGMMMIGLGLASLHHFKLDTVFIAMAFLAKFLVWPLVVLIFIAIDNAFLHIYSTHMHNALVLLSIVPMGANMVIVASLLKAQPEKAAASVFLSTVFALLYIPLMAGWFIS